MRFYFLFLTAIISTLFCNSALAVITTADIQKKIDNFIATQIHTEGSLKIKVDNDHMNQDLQLADCANFSVAMANLNMPLRGRISLKINCEQPHWTVYAPIYIHLYDNVLLSKKVFRKNEVITDDQVQIKPMEVTGLTRGYFSDFKQIQGFIAQRFIPANQILIPETLSIQPLIHKGDEITLSFMANGLSIKTAGIALADGQQGDQILVQNKESGSKVSARVVNSGIVCVNP